MDSLVFPMMVLARCLQTSACCLWYPSRPTLCNYSFTRLWCATLFVSFFFQATFRYPTAAGGRVVRRRVWSWLLLCLCCFTSQLSHVRSVECLSQDRDLVDAAASTYVGLVSCKITAWHPLVLHCAQLSRCELCSHKCVGLQSCLLKNVVQKLSSLFCGALLYALFCW